MTRRLSSPVRTLALVAAAAFLATLTPACGGSGGSTASGGSSGSAGSAGSGGGAGSGSGGSAGSAGSGGSDAGCSGSVPVCLNNDSTLCCAQDPSGMATCVNGKWMCGSAPAPGCNGKSCRLSDAGSCTGSAPLCFGVDSSQCCGQDPSGSATCVNGAWRCGSAPAPGCNGTNCMVVDAGP